MSLTKYVCKEGTAPTSETVVYTVPVGARARWRSLSLVNPGSVAYWVRVYVRSQGSTSIRVMDVTLSAGDSVYVGDLPLLPAGSTVRVQAEATTPQYVMSFEEEHDV